MSFVAVRSFSLYVAPWTPNTSVAFEGALLEHVQGDCAITKAVLVMMIARLASSLCSVYALDANVMT